MSVIFIWLLLTVIIGVVLAIVAYFVFRNSKYLDKAQGVVISISFLFFGVSLGIYHSNSLKYYLGIGITAAIAYFLGLNYTRARLQLAKQREEKKQHVIK